MHPTNRCTPPAPGYCARIVGDLPTPEQQQEFVELVRTEGMRLPHDRLRIQVQEQSLTVPGLRLAGTLTLDGQPVGAIRDDGYGHGARLDPPHSPALAAYVDRCRYRGHPVTLQRLLNALVNEHHRAPRRRCARLKQGRKLSDDPFGRDG